MIGILLHEGRLDEAWAAAGEFGCSKSTWFTLARAREQTHPHDAIELYEPEVFIQIKQTKAAAYDSAVELMERIRRLSNTAGKPERFQLLLKRVRTEHRAKRTLQQRLNNKHW